MAFWKFGRPKAAGAEVSAFKSFEVWILGRKEIARLALLQNQAAEDGKSKGSARKILPASAVRVPLRGS